MHILTPNDVAVYNLVSEKTIPDWLPIPLRRKLAKEDEDVGKRIELIQDFEMPAVSNKVRLTEDEQYVFASGTYKPRLRCYELAQLSMKFERCMDAENVAFEFLTPDGSKLVVLRNDRYLEVHSKGGKYYMFRIPRFGRSLAYNSSSCDLYVTGTSKDVWRFNFEQGRYLNILETGGSGVNVCKINPVHQLFVCGTEEGQVEAWDPRCRRKVGVLDCAFSAASEVSDIEGIPSITSLAFRDGITMGVGTATGQVLIYDIRSNKPTIIKDHMYGFPIKNISFHLGLDLVLSMDKRVVKMWEQNTGKIFTFIEASCEINDMCLVPNSGILFVANESPRILTYFIPALGAAPKWCSFLDCLTEELEENRKPNVYDDYKFVTQKELEELGLTHLIGSKLLRGYMHGYFMDIRLFHKAKSAADPFAYEDYIKKKIQTKIEEERGNRVRLKKLPRVNKELANSLLQTAAEKKHVLLSDKRFSAMFEKPEYQIDEKSQEFRQLKFVSASLQKMSSGVKDSAELETRDGGQQDGEKSASEDEFSSDDEQKWIEEVRKKRTRTDTNSSSNVKMLKEPTPPTKESSSNTNSGQQKTGPKFLQLREGEEFKGLRVGSFHKQSKESLGERLRKEFGKGSDQIASTMGNMEMTFTVKGEDGSDVDSEEEHHKGKMASKRGKGSQSFRGRGRGNMRGRGRGRGGYNSTRGTSGGGIQKRTPRSAMHLLPEKASRGKRLKH